MKPKVLEINKQNAISRHIVIEMRGKIVDGKMMLTDLQSFFLDSSSFILQ